MLDVPRKSWAAACHKFGARTLTSARSPLSMAATALLLTCVCSSRTRAASTSASVSATLEGRGGAATNAGSPASSSSPSTAACTEQAGAFPHQTRGGPKSAGNTAWNCPGLLPIISRTAHSRHPPLCSQTAKAFSTYLFSGTCVEASQLQRHCPQRQTPHSAGNAAERRRRSGEQHLRWPRLQGPPPRPPRLPPSARPSLGSTGACEPCLQEHEIVVSRPT